MNIYIYIALFAPFMPASLACNEYCHRLISRACLLLVEGALPANVCMCMYIRYASMVDENVYCKWECVIRLCHRPISRTRFEQAFPPSTCIHICMNIYFHISNESMRTSSTCIFNI